MGIITVSRTFGAGGSFFARELARVLGYDYLDRRIIQKICLERKDNVCAFGMEDEKTASFFDKIADLMSGRSFYKLNLMANIYDYALKNNVVFTGMGANVVLSGAEDVLNIQIVMPLSERVKVIAAREKMSMNDALALVRKRDDDKRDFLKYLFDRDINDPTLYHLVINSARISLEDGVEMTASYCSKHFTPGLSLQTNKFLRSRLLEKRAELLLHRLGIAQNYAKVMFEAQNEGTLMIKGVIGGEHEKRALFDALKRIKEITQIENHLKVGALSQQIY
jgi:CMP/dCMP kinase